MRVWFPAIRAGSGSDVYTERLVAALRGQGVDARLQWFDHRYEIFPGLLGKIKPPGGTDVIHANSWNGFAFARAGLPLVVTAFHCVYRCGYPEWKTRAQAFYHDLWIGRYERRSFARAAAVVAMTPSAADDFQKRFTLPQLALAHGWVDTETFKPATDATIADGTVRILIVGNNSKRKGMDLLPQLQNHLGSEFSITVVGGLRAGRSDVYAGATYRRRLSESELVREYQRADLVVSMSRYEGFGYTALEAMACAKPVVAFAATGIRDVVHDGESGVLVPIDDVEAMAEACIRLAADRVLMRQYGARGVFLAREVYGKDRALSNYLDLYARLVGTSRR